MEEKPTLYVSGMMKHTAKNVMCVFTPTKRGWQCRSTLLDAGLNHDYESRESLEALRGWAQIDLKHGSVMTTSREEALGLLSQQIDSTTSSERDLLLPPAAFDTAAWAEQVLAHLQRGW